MAVEAHSLLQAAAGGEPGWVASAPAPALGGRYGCYGAGVAGEGRRRMPAYQQHRQLTVGSLLGQEPYGQLCAATPADVASESGVTFGSGVQEAALVPRKRKRAELGQPPVLGLASPDVAAHFQQELIDVDRLVLQHTSKVWAELTELRRRHTRQVVAAVEASAAKRLRAKDEEIQRISRLNWALEERVKTLFVEAQMWRNMAQSNDAAATALRGELQQVLDTQTRRGVIAGAGDDDVESCCYGENDVVAAEQDAGEAAVGRVRCKTCGDSVADVLLLPCRHMTMCTACAAAAPACPACGCAKNGSVIVNFS